MGTTLDYYKHSNIFKSRWGFGTFLNLFILAPFSLYVLDGPFQILSSWHLKELNSKNSLPPTKKPIEVKNTLEDCHPKFQQWNGHFLFPDLGSSCFLSSVCFRYDPMVQENVIWPQ